MLPGGALPPPSHCRAGASGEARRGDVVRNRRPASKNFLAATASGPAVGSVELVEDAKEEPR